jgi:hypothetical protein
VRIWEADLVTREPIRGTLTATGYLLNRRIPLTLGPVDVPLATLRKLRKDKVYFLELRSANAATCAKVEGRFLSDSSAGETEACTFVASTDSGTSFRPLGSSTGFDASQTRFTLDVLKTTVVQGMRSMTTWVLRKG